ncbi:hypothetical protein GCM10010169_29920 [Micromonospora fulviviridis]|nr:hypothetical protein GCM10010169_29920 [Micromonospora fulviviridis]
MTGGRARRDRPADRDAVLPDRSVLTRAPVVGTLSSCARASPGNACVRRNRSAGDRAAARQSPKTWRRKFPAPVTETRYDARAAAPDRDSGDTPDRGCWDPRQVALVGM